MKDNIINIVRKLYADVATEFNKTNKQKIDEVFSLLLAEFKTEDNKDGIVTIQYLKGFHFSVASYKDKQFLLHIISSDVLDQDSRDSFDYEKPKYPICEYNDYGCTLIRTVDFDDTFYDAITALNHCMLPIYYIDASLNEVYCQLVYGNSDMGLVNKDIDVYVDLPRLINMEGMSIEKIEHIGNNIKNYIQEKADVTIRDVEPVYVKKEVNKTDLLKHKNLIKVMNAEQI